MNVIVTARMIPRFFRRYSCLLIFAASFLFSDAKSQSGRIEPVLTYEYGYPLAIERAPGIVNRFGTSGSGKSYGHTLGLGLAIQLPDLFTNTIGISPQLQYRFSLGKFTSDQYNSLIAVDGKDQPIASTNTFEVVSKIHSFDLSLPLRLTLEKTGISFGPWGSIDIGRDITGKEFIVSPSDAHFRGDGISQTFASGDTISTSHLHGGLEAGLSLQIPVSRSLALVPLLYSRVDLSVISVAKSKAISFGLSLALSAIADHQIQLPIDTFVKVEALPKLTASIHFAKNGMRIDAHTPIDVTGYSTSFRQYTEYLPEIYFDEGSQKITDGYAYLDPSGAVQYSISSLANKKLPEYEKNTLSILGIRFKNDSLSEIILTASYTNSENQRLAQKRGEAVKDYLANIWRVDPKRISIATTKTSQKPSVSFSPSDQSITAPIATQWIERSFHIPHMGIEKNISAEAGLKSWDVVIMQNGKMLSHFSSNEPPAEQTFADFDLLGDPDEKGYSNSEAAPLIADLKVEDFRGQTTEAKDTLALPSVDDLQKKMINRKAFIFIFLQLPKRDTIHNQMEELLMQRLLNVVGKGAHITITNPVFVLSDPESGQSIAERIVSSLKRRTDLGADVHIVQSSQPKDPSDPYERSVMVRIEQDDNK